jgi:hypothetical protein
MVYENLDIWQLRWMHCLVLTMNSTTLGVPTGLFHDKPPFSIQSLHFIIYNLRLPCYYNNISVTFLLRRRCLIYFSKLHIDIVKYPNTTKNLVIYDGRFITDHPIFFIKQHLWRNFISSWIEHHKSPLVTY